MKKLQLYATATLSLILLPESFLSAGVPSLSFTNIQEGSGVEETSSRGGAWGDYDADGFQDLWTGDVLYRNLDGTGIFEEVIDLPQNTSGSRAGTAWADFNNDGWLDIFAGSQWLYENVGGTGEFTLHSSDFGLDGSFASQAVCWGDYDQDGWVDVYVVGDQEAVGAVYRNLDGLGFEDVTAALGVEDPREGYGGTWCDPDGDGDLDLHIGNCADFVLDMRMDVYFENQNGTFVERGEPLGLRNTSNSWVTAWADYDNDGDTDVLVANTDDADHFYRNDDGVFVDLAGQAGIPDGSSREASWGDFDNDGYLDIYIGRQNGRNRLYHNDGDGTFTEIAADVGVDDNRSTVVASVADMDNDGDLDLYLGNSGGSPSIYRNELGASNWLILRLQGTTSNRSAIGARVLATSGAVTRLRDVLGGNGLYTQPMLPVHFGLGDSTQVDHLEIRWPSGLVQVFENLDANQFVCLTEGGDLIEECTPVTRPRRCPAQLSCAADQQTRTVSLKWNEAFNLDAAGLELRRDGELIASPSLDATSFDDDTVPAIDGELQLEYELRVVGGADDDLCPPLLCRVTLFAGGVVLADDFEAYPSDAAVEAAGWAIVDVNDPVEESTWTLSNPGGRDNPPGADGRASGGRFMISDSDAQSGSNPTGSGMSHDLWSPTFNCADREAVWLHLDASVQLNNNGQAVFDIDVTIDGGLSWTNVLRRVAPSRTEDAPVVTVDNAGGFFGRLDVDLTAVSAGEEAVRFRIRHFEPNFDWWIAIDNVVVDDIPPPVGEEVLLANEGFEDGIPSEWSVRGLNAGNDSWTTNDPCERSIVRAGETFPHQGGSGLNRLGATFAIMDSDCSGGAEDEYLITPVLDCRDTEEVVLHFRSEILPADNATQEVLVSLDGGVTFEPQPIFSYSGGGLFDAAEEAFYAERAFRVMAAVGQATVAFAFHYASAGNQEWWAVDDVRVTATRPRTPEGGMQLPSDCDQDGNLSLTDAICLLNFLFLGRAAELIPCEGGLQDSPNLLLFDFNGDDVLDLSDAVAELNFLFLGGGPPELGRECLPILGCPDNPACGEL